MKYDTNGNVRLVWQDYEGNDVYEPQSVRDQYYRMVNDPNGNKWWRIGTPEWNGNGTIDNGVFNYQGLQIPITTGMSGQWSDENGPINVSTSDQFIPYDAASFIADKYGSQGGDAFTKFLDKGGGIALAGIPLGAAIYADMAAAGAGSGAQTGAAAIRSLPSSYLNMVADAGGVASDAAPVAAGAIGSAAPATAAMPALAGPAMGASEVLGTAGATASGGGGLASLWSSMSNNPLSWLSAAQAVAGLAGGVGAYKAGSQASDAANNATAAQMQMFNTLNAQGAPYRTAGYSALEPMMAGIGMGPAAGGVDVGQFTHQFNANDLNANLAPNWKFSLEQGQGAAANALNAAGGVGGNYAKGLVDYTLNKSGDLYQNAFSNYNTNQTNIFNRLSSIAGLGTTTNAQSAQSGSSLGTGAANTTVASGAAQAAGTSGVSNALSNALTNAASWYSLPAIYNMAQSKA